MSRSVRVGTVGVSIGLLTMTLRATVAAFVIGIGLGLTGAGRADGAGSITGQGRFEKIVNRPAMGHKLLYEWDLFLSPADDSMVGFSRRLGAPPGETPRGDGYYRIDNVPAGVYSIYVNQPDFFASPRVVPDVEIVDGQTLTLNVDLDIDYSTYFHDTAGEQWSGWEWAWHQTFLATGTSVRGVSWRMAGGSAYNGKYADVSILEDNGNANPRYWTEIATKRDGQIGSDSDEWVRWLAGEVPLTPGRMYAVKIWIEGGFAVYKRDKDGNSYPHGRAYSHDGNAQNYDLCITVFVDKSNQTVTHTRVQSGPGQFSSNSGTRWCQSFVASGQALAAVDLFAASGESSGNGDITATWRILRDGPNGQQVGPAKIARGSYFASSTDLVGVSYNPDHVPLTPGRTYCIEIVNPEGLTPYFQESWNRYSDGTAYRGSSAIGEDLSMTIVEYIEGPAPEMADVNADDKVDFQDYAMMADALDWTGSPGGIPEDVIRDGAVDFVDIDFLSQTWLDALPQKPQVQIITPANGAEQMKYIAFDIVAEAVDPDGQVVQVEFYAGSVSLGVDYDGSDGWNVSAALAMGDYSLTARATDNDSQTATSPPVDITVAEPPR